MKLINEEEYTRLKSERSNSNQSDQERERNLLVLMSLRPEFFELEDQIKFEQIQWQMKKTAVFAIGGFACTSGFRYWQIKHQDKRLALGISVIILSYLPAFTYYSYHRQIQSEFIRSVSHKYADRISNDKLTQFLKK